MKFRVDAVYVGAVCALVVLSLGLNWGPELVSILGEGARIVPALVLLIAVAVHVPATLPVSKIRSLMRFELSAHLPVEYVFSGLILLSWATLAATGGGWKGMVCGALFATAVLLGFLAVKLFDRLAEKLALLAAPHPDPQIGPVKLSTMRYAYLLRVVAVVLSLVAAFTRVGAGVDMLALTAGLSVLSGMAALGVAAFGLSRIKVLAEAARATADDALTRMERQLGAADVLLYASDRPGAKHQHLKTLAKELHFEGVRSAIIAREANHVKMLKSFDADFVWCAPYIAGLDAVARPESQVVFYTHDGLKNGHFTRFSHLSHVLDATTGMLARSEMLPNALNMYDYVIAPSPEVAIKWRAHLPDDDAGRVVTLDLKPLIPLPEQASISANSHVALSLPAPKSVRDFPRAEHMHLVNALVERFKCPRANLSNLSEPEGATIPNRPIEPGHLHIGIAAEKSAPLTPWHEALKELGTDTDQVSISTQVEPAHVTWNRADIAYACSPDQVTRLRATAKPILWLGTDSAPECTTVVDLETPEPLWTFAVERACPDPLHFSTMRAFLTYIQASRKSAT